MNEGKEARTNGHRSSIRLWRCSAFALKAARQQQEAAQRVKPPQHRATVARGFGFGRGSVSCFDTFDHKQLITST